MIILIVIALVVIECDLYRVYNDYNSWIYLYARERMQASAKSDSRGSVIPAREGRRQLARCSSPRRRPSPPDRTPSAAEAGKRGDYRGETPRTPPSAGEVAHGT
jgi:hypothetical protein